MSKTLFLTFIFLFSTKVFCQVNEPTVIGEVLALNGNSTTPLEKQRASIETKAGASMYIVGMGKISSKITIDGGNSSVRFEKGKELTFIVRARDNNIDPLATVNFFKFIPSSSRKSSRYAEVSSVGTFSSVKSNNFDFIEFTAEKYGEGSYLLHVQPLDLGEYGIIVNDPSMTGSKITIISCFGIGTIDEYKENNESIKEGYETLIIDD